MEITFETLIEIGKEAHKNKVIQVCRIENINKTRRIHIVGEPFYIKHEKFDKNGKQEQIMKESPFARDFCKKMKKLAEKNGFSVKLEYYDTRLDIYEKNQADEVIYNGLKKYKEMINNEINSQNKNNRQEKKIKRVKYTGKE